METNIKFFLTDKTWITRGCQFIYNDDKGDESNTYEVFFEDGSSILIYNARSNSVYSKARSETRKGKMRNDFAKTFKASSAVDILKKLEQEYGYVDVYLEGNRVVKPVVLVNSKNLKTQFIIP